nr:MAG TPA: hypothetical protein [Caudoviricetes sp.]
MTTNLYESPTEMLLAVHEEKSRVYGSSWCKRGELFSILPNIGRKVDRLGRAGAGDTELDTRLDLVAYLSLYAGWLWRNRSGMRSDLVPELLRSPDLTDWEWELLTPIQYEQKSVQEVLLRYGGMPPNGSQRLADEPLVRSTRRNFDRLCKQMEADTDYLKCLEFVDRMLQSSLELFSREWQRARRERLSWNPEA